MNIKRSHGYGWPAVVSWGNHSLSKSCHSYSLKMRKVKQYIHSPFQYEKLKYSWPRLSNKVYDFQTCLRF